MLYFSVKFTMAPEVVRITDDRNALLDRWLKEAVEPNGLHFGGGGLGEEWKGYVEPRLREDATEADRQPIESWLKNNPLVVSYEIGPLFSDSDLTDSDDNEPK